MWRVRDGGCCLQKEEQPFCYLCGWEPREKQYKFSEQMNFASRLAERTKGPLTRLLASPQPPGLGKKVGKGMSSSVKDRSPYGGRVTLFVLKDAGI